jgi:IPT/TIG domain/Proprotein convertase P-domain
MLTNTRGGPCVPTQSESDEPTKGRAMDACALPRRRGIALALMGALLAFVLAFAAVPAGAAVFSNSGPIAIPAWGQANPYPSAITVSGLGGTITNVHVTLTGVSHTWPEDIDVLLVGPSGQSVVLLADAGGGEGINNINLTFDDAAPTLVPSPIVAGTYRPTNGGALSVFNGTAPNGTWNLFVYDDLGGYSGAIAGGWSLDITTPNGLNVTAPNGGETYAKYSTQTATWTTPAHTTGTFALWAVSEPGGAHIWIGSQDAVAGQTSYSLDWYVTPPSGDYRLRVSYGFMDDDWRETDYSDDPFTIAAVEPWILDFAPTSGGVGTVVTLNGTDFTGATAVAFHGTAATSVTVDNDWQITATVPAGATTGTIAVTTPGGTGYSDDPFTVIPAPTVSGFAPTSGPVGTVVTLTGTHLTGATVVAFHGTAATSVTVDNDWQITATVPAGATTGTIAVTTPGGSAASAASFTVIQPLTVTAPNGGETYAKYSSQTATWSTPAQTTGTFGLWAVSEADGTHLWIDSQDAVAGQTSYSLDWYVTQPPGDYRLRVSYGVLGGPWPATDYSDAPFTITAAEPWVSGFTPTSGGVGTVVTLDGVDLTGASVVAFNGTAATSVTVDNDWQITATVPAGATTGTIAVTTPGGTGYSYDPFTVIPAPTVSGFAPTSGPVGTVVTLTGTNFSGATVVAFHGTAATSVTVNNDSQITATVPAGATTGTIAVTTPGGSAASAASFTVTVLPAAPTVSGFTPTSGPVGTVVTLTGTGFSGATVVAFHGTAAVTFTLVNPTHITATVPAGATTGTIAVTTPGGTGYSYDPFTVIPAPTVSGFAPTSGPVGTTVTLTGTGFSGATAVAFHGTAATFTFVNPTHITAIVPAGATTGTIAVTTPGGSATSAASFTVTVLPAAPTVTGFTPTSGPVGTVVTLTGTGFSGATVVAFHGTAATFTFVNPTHITVTVPAGATTGTIAVTTPGGSATSAASFTVTVLPAAPTVSGFTPSSGPVGTTVTLTGTGFTGATAVAFHGVAATFTVNSATKITATVPSGATTGTIAVTTPGGTATSAASFTVTVLPAAPTVSGFTPSSGPVGTTVTLTGTGLSGATGVKFNGVAATFTVNSATKITATVPAGATTGQVTVTTPGGTAASATSFTVVFRPKVTLKLSGLRSGAMRLGRRVTAKGKVTPTSLAGTYVKLKVQKKKSGRWVTVKTKSRLISATGTYSWKYKPLKKGSYRMRAQIAQTATHTAAKTVWRKFKVT